MSRRHAGVSHPLYPTLDKILIHIRELSKASVDSAVSIEELARQLVAQSQEWKSNQDEAERIIRQILEDGVVGEQIVKEEKHSTTRKESRHRQEGEGGSREHKRKRHSSSRHGRKDRKRRKHETSRSRSDRKESRPVEQPLPIEVEPVPPPPIQEVAAVAPSEPQQDAGLNPEHLFFAVSKERENELCQRCSGDMAKKAGSLSNKQLTKLICELLLKDEEQFQCRHCFCDKCTGIKTSRKTRCRKYKAGYESAPASVCSTTGTCDKTQCDKNTEVIMKYLNKAIERRSRRRSASSRRKHRSKSRRSQKAGSSRERKRRKRGVSQPI